MVGLIAYAIYVQGSVFLNFLKSGRIIFSFFDIVMFVVIVFFDNFFF